MNEKPYKTRRSALIFSGATDVVLGAIILLVGFGFFPIDIADYGLPFWVVMLVGGLLFTSGIWMAVHNYSRLDE